MGIGLPFVFLSFWLEKQLWWVGTWAWTEFWDVEKDAALSDDKGTRLLQEAPTFDKCEYDVSRIYWVWSLGLVLAHNVLGFLSQNAKVGKERVDTFLDSRLPRLFIPPGVSPVASFALDFK